MDDTTKEMLSVHEKPVTIPDIVFYVGIHLLYILMDKPISGIRREHVLSQKSLLVPENNYWRGK